MEFCLGVFGMDFFSALSGEKSFLVVFVGVLKVMDICFGNVAIPPFFILVIVLSFVIFCLWIGVLGLGVFFGMVSCLHLLALVGLLLGLLRMMMLLMLGWRDCWVLTLKACVGSGFLLITFLRFVLDELLGVGVCGCGVYSLKSGACWFGRR